MAFNMDVIHAKVVNIVYDIIHFTLYIIHFSKDTPAQYASQNKYTYIIHNIQNHTRSTYRVHATSLEENYYSKSILNFSLT